jgi:uncharacterized protein YecT (DUF1311 family)
MKTSAGTLASIAGLAALVAIAVAGIASEPGPVVDCSAAGRTQSDINLCATAEADRATKSLDDLLAALRAKLSVPEWKELQSVQEDWSRFVDHQCRWEASLLEGGSIAPASSASCQRTLTRQRIDVLKSFLCEGAGMTGPCQESRRF